MTAGSVVDASSLAALLFSEAASDRLAELLGGGPLAAPHLLPFELANVCRKKIAQGTQAAEVLLDALSAWTLFDITLHPVQPRAVTALALDTGLSAYDASYLWLARTLDQRLARAAVAP